MDKHERAESVLRLDEWALSEILPVYNEATKSYTPTVDDPIIVSIDFETLCRFAQGTYPGSHWMRGTPYDYNPITEIGWTIFDTRELAKKTTPPGDRAVNLHRQMNASHYIINEFRGHFGRNCNLKWSHETEPYNFAYGTSQYLASEDIATILTRRFENVLKTRNLTKHERTNKIPGNMVFLAWDVHLEMDALDRLDLD